MKCPPLQSVSSIVSSGILASAASPQVGFFVDVCEALAEAHERKRGDVTGSLVAGEWYMRNGKFVSWGRPYEFNARLKAR